MENDISNNRYTQQILRLAQVLELGEPKVSGNDLNMLCPFHKESNPSFGINTETGLYNCFSCGAKGHISKFLENLRCNILADRTDSLGEFEVTAKIDTVSFSVKPSKAETGIIRNRLYTSSMSRYKIKKLLEFITTGHTISLSGAKKNTEWQGQQIVMIDLDNEYAKTFTDILNYAKSVDLEPTFAYQTYSSTENICRCRLAYVFTEPITDKQRYLSIYGMFIRKFQDYSIDKSCTDLCRLFYGTMNKDVYIGNLLYSSCRFTSEQLNEVGQILGKGYRSTKSKGVVADSTTRDTETGEVDISYYMDGKKFQHDKFAKNLMQQYHFITLNTLPHFYRDGLYINNNGNREVEKLIKKYLPSLGSLSIKEVLNDLALFSESKQETDYHTLAFKNGLVDIENPELKPFTPDVVLTSKLDVNFVNLNITTCSNDIVDKFMSDITDRR